MNNRINWFLSKSKPSIDYLNLYADKLNLQADKAANFVTSGGLISQWNDLSPSANHATATLTARPTLTGLNPTFNGTANYLTLTTEFQATVFSVYFVIKNSATGTLKVPIGGVSVANTYVSFGQNLGQMNFISGANSFQTNCWGDEFYQVISLRRNGSTWVAKCNGRTLQILSNSWGAAVASVFGYIGRTSGGFYWNGIVKSVVMSSQYLSDSADIGLTNQLFTKYALPESSTAITAFGDSIIYGTGASTRTNGWAFKLATAKSRAIKNFGISSTPLSNSAAFANNGQDRYATQVVERPYSDTICMMYGTNDISYGYSGANYQAAANAVVGGFVTAGYPTNKIYIVSIPYRQTDALASTVQDFNSRMQTVCTSYGVTFIDVYTPMKAVGDSLMADIVHPNDAGHQLIADTVAAIIS